MEKSSSFIFKGASVLALGAFLSKVIGAIYRIPLTNLLGADGIGLYQTVFPLYVILLDISSAGVPSALSQIISKYRGKEEFSSVKKVFSESVKLFFIIGLFGTLLMIIFSRFLSNLQGNKDAYLSYIFLAPSILLVSLISCFRGYFQGKKSMRQTAVSQVIEQVIKLTFGLILVRAFLPDVKRATAGAVFAVTLSEIFALSYLYFSYKKEDKKMPKGVLESLENDRIKLRILRLTVPVTLTVMALPLSGLIDSFLVINILSRYTEKATSLYGLYSGSALTIIHLPTSLLYGLSQVVIPLLSGSKNQEEKNEKIRLTLLVTTVLSTVFAIGIFFISPFAVKVLFNKLSAEEKQITVRLIKIMSVNVIFHSILQTANGILIGKSKTLKSLFGTMSGVVVKTILSIILLFNPTFNIYGVAISSIACYFTAGLINLMLSLDTKVQDAVKKDRYRRNYRRE